MPATRDSGPVAADAPIVASGLSKRYHGRPAVDAIDLTVLPGEIFGFLGPNGAGKTTTMRMLLGLVRPDAGRISLYGHDAIADGLRARRQVAGIIEEPRLYRYLSARRNLQLLHSYDRRGRDPRVIERALELVELSDRAGERVADYSQGMRQRLGIAACLVRQPRLLLLDEPANGLDPAGIRFLRGLLRQLAETGITVLLSSHLLAEVQELCGRVAIITEGRIVYEGSLDELRARAGRRYRLATDDQHRAMGLVSGLPGIDGLELVDGQIEFTIRDDYDLRLLSRGLADADLLVQALIPEQLTLERLFFELTERPHPAQEPHEPPEPQQPQEVPA